MDIHEEAAIHGLRIATGQQMREFDRRAVEEFGVPSIVLMENAGRHVADVVRTLLTTLTGKRVCIVSGKGNNGGDGFVAARHLRDNGAQVSVLLLGDPADVKGDARVNLDILLKSGGQVESLTTAARLSSVLARSHAVVDAIFGTGLRGEVTGLPAEIIETINESGVPVVAVDLPSGLDADSGRIWGVCVRANQTVTFALPKIGLLSYPGAMYAGEVIVGEIGIPHQLYDDIKTELTDDAWVTSRLPRRLPDSHKGTFGTTIVLAGSAGFTGAAAMASEAALKVGAGLCTLGIPISMQDVMAVKLTEMMTRGLPETDSRALSADALEPALDLCSKATSVVLGCGLGTHPGTCEFVYRFLSSAKLPVVVDADALNCLAKDTRILEGEHGELVLTPHPGEMARLLGTRSDSIQSNRMDVVREAAARFRSVVVLKGARTLVADPSGRVFVNPTGNAGLAKGGTGDVLAGCIGGLIAQGVGAFDAAVCGVFIHGRAGDLAASAVGTAGMLAGDLLGALPKTLKDLCGS